MNTNAADMNTNVISPCNVALFSALASLLSSDEFKTSVAFKSVIISIFDLMQADNVEPRLSD